MMQEEINVFVQLRDVCDEVIQAYENNDESKLEFALGKFMLLMLKLDALK